MRCDAMPCRAVPFYAVPCHAVPCRATPCHAMPCKTTPCHENLRHALTIQVMVSYCMLHSIPDYDLMQCHARPTPGSVMPPSHANLCNVPHCSHRLCAEYSTPSQSTLFNHVSTSCKPMPHHKFLRHAHALDSRSL